MNFPEPATLLHSTDGNPVGGGTPPPPPPALAVGAMFGGYRILRVIGGGGMGQVFEAYDAELARSVALKVMRPDRASDPDASERFVREARALAAVSNPHVVTIHHVSQHDGQPFLVMELVAGVTLEAHLRNGNVPLLQLLNTAREVASGLAAAHRAGVIHRDVKPDNVVLSASDGRAKLIDFGLAHTTRVGDDGDSSVGTPLYMAPEQVRGTAVTARSDLFSFGVLLYRMATGRTPFEGGSVNDWRDRLLSPDPPTPVEQLNPTIPPPLAELIHRLLAKDPDERPESARAVEWELATVLKEVAGHSGVYLPEQAVNPSSAGGTPALAPRPRLPWWLWVAVACPVVLILGLALTVGIAPRGEHGGAGATPTNPQPPTRGEPIALFNGRDLKGWHGVEGKKDQWAVKSGVIVGTHKLRTAEGKGGDQFLLTDREFTDYELTFEFRWPAPGGHTTILLRARDDWPDVEEDWTRDKYRVTGLNLNLKDDAADGPPAERKPSNELYASGGFYKLRGPKPAAPNKPIGEWNAVKVILDRSQLRVEWNGVVTFDEDLDQFTKQHKELPALSRTKGAIALRTHSARPIEYRNLVLTPILR